MARFGIGTRAPDRALFALLRGVAVLVGIGFVLVAVGYTGYLRFTDIDPPEVEVAPAAFHVDPTGRRLSYGRASLSRDGKLWRLSLAGSPVEMGDARGRLTARQFREIDGLVRDAMDQRYGAWLESWTATMILRWDYRGADAFLDEAHRAELAAMALALPEADGDRVAAYHRLFLYQCFHGLSQRLDDVLIEGSMFAAAPRRAGDPGNLVIGRSLSVDLGPSAEPDRIVTLHHPDGRYPFASVGWAGLVGVVTGINARGIFVGLDAARTDDPLEEGAPLPLVLRQVLEEADTLEQAIEMLEDAALRTSGIVLLGDGVQRRAVVMELSARDREDRRVVRGEDDAIVWATDHMISEPFDADLANDWVRRYTSSGPRHDRLGELLAAAETVDPAAAVAILRDRRGPEDAALGLGNRNALENLATTHAVVVDATGMVLWVSEGPSVLGRFRAIDLRRELGRDAQPPAPLPDLPPDPLLFSEEYRDYLEALDAIEHARELLGRGLPERAKWSAEVALALAPDIGELHRLLGDIERELGDIDAARAHYHRYLALVPGRRRDQVRVEGILAELEG